jgi:hypothetical protein
MQNQRAHLVRTLTLAVTFLFSGVAFSGARPAYGSSALWIQQAQLIASDPREMALFGWSVAVDGDTAVVGSPDIFGGTGAAYVFVNTEQGWSLQQKLTASGSTSGDGFGLSVAISGDTIVVGTPYDNDSFDTEGSVYVFARNGEVWSVQQKLTADDPRSNLQFGVTVAISGETLAVGSGGDAGGAFAAGAAYVFSRSETGWSQQQKLIADDAASGDFFAYMSIAIDGDTIVVGAPGDDDDGLESGSTYVFERERTAWSQRQKLTAAADARSGALFGYAVAIRDKTIVVGSPYDLSSGAAYLFAKRGRVWEARQRLRGTDPFGFFGGSAAVGDHAILIGAETGVTTGNNLGTAYVFVGNNGHWEGQQKLPESDGTVRRCFGKSVAISGDTALVGSPCDNHDESLIQLSGSAYVYGEARQH